MRGRPFLLLSALTTMILGACAPGSTSQSPAARSEAGAPDNRTMVMIIRQDPPSIASKPLRTAGSSIASATRLFNADLDYTDDKEGLHPYISEALPRLDTDSWFVYPDGRMQTSYKLKPNLVWHDGTAFSAEDFVFAHRVYRTPELGASDGRPIAVMESVQAPDPRTVIIGWSAPYPEADSIGSRFQALPRHILEAPFQTLTPDGFIAHPYWSIEYVGMGPYRLVQWEPGAFIEGAAFDQHVLSRPKIGRVRVLFMNDANVVLANMLSGETHIAADNSLKFEQAAILQREWGQTGGTVLLSPTQWRSTEVQFRPEVLKTSALLDLRVRRAIIHAMDRAQLNETLLGGYGLLSETPVSPLVPYGAEIDRAISKYPYDPRRTEQLMNEAGFTKGADGLFASAPGAESAGRTSGERFRPDWMTLSGAQNEAELAILVDSMKRAGIEIVPYVLPSAQLADARARSLYPGLSSTSGGSGYTDLRSAPPLPENRMLGGGGRGGWSNPDMDRLADAYNGTLNKSERQRYIVEMSRVFTEQLPKLSHYFNVRVTAHLASMTGPLLGTSPDAGSESWNVHLWEWK